jgi:hypothetical protein
MSVTVPPVAPTPDTYTPVTQFGAALINALAPWMTLHLAWVCDAIGVMADPLYTLVMDQGEDGDPGYVPGYGSLMDPTLAAAEDLPFLGQFVGVQIPVGSSDAAGRSLVIAEAGLNRGTPSAVVAAAKRNLTGTQSVAYFERVYVDGTPNAGWFGLVVRPEECSSVAALTIAVEAVKFGGLRWWLVQTDGWTITGMEASQATITALEGAFVTINGLENDRPGT